MRAMLRALALAGMLLAPCAAPAQQVVQRSPLPRLTTLLGQTREPAAERDSLVALARAQVGRRYLFGGSSPEEGFDCSGLVKYLMRAMGVQLPRTADQQSRVGEEVPVDPSRLNPGDLLTFGRGDRITHIGIYVGNGRYVHASSVAGRVIESPLDRPESALARAWRGVRRVLAGDTTAVAAR